ncbi:hypothetical protein Dsin_031958 [Dipteronia sinensis]|uniref:Uncharacterized protein n=1 Tax=Dipteronia sinensis TaxID=43782 RepID=A0AAD9ZMN2_9ROSI|nr:hypothetical protein Dsin_031958 [Dipteronia sinensis]
MDMKLKMNMSTTTPMHTTKRQKSCFRHLLPTMFLLSAVFFIGSAFVVRDYRQRIARWGALNSVQNTVSKMCETHCRPHGIETLPKGIISRTSDLEMRSLSGPEDKKKSKKSMNLVAIAAGIKQKESVNKIVKKFPPSDFVVMLFHYDGIVEEWNDFEWSAHAIHVSVMNQTKWWFAKRFLHPDIILNYAYIFLWDEDLGVDNFHAGRYLSIIKEEGLEISQPALDPDKSELHHYLTVRDRRSRVHRRIYKKIGRKKCDENSTNPPCTGFVEMMAPVFSRASWHCAWHMIQNDLVHAWGLDFQLGYCAQGDPTKNIGIVDSEYIVHYGLPTLGGVAANKTDAVTTEQTAQNTKLSSSEQQVPLSSYQPTGRDEVRKRSYTELEIFKNRWKKAVKDDDSWIDIVQQSQNQMKH